MLFQPKKKYKASIQFQYLKGYKQKQQPITHKQA